MRKSLWLFVGVGLIVLLTIGAYVVSNGVRMRRGAESACADYLSAKLGRSVDPDDVEATVPEVFFPSRYEKRFRSTCKFEGATLVLESSPLKSWQVVVVEGID